MNTRVIETRGEKEKEKKERQRGKEKEERYVLELKRSSSRYEEFDRNAIERSVFDFKMVLQS